MGQNQKIDLLKDQKFNQEIREYCFFYYIVKTEKDFLAYSLIKFFKKNQFVYKLKFKKNIN
ncbi:hypothetical protein [Candidatus Phytoplasma pyri]|uniref:hypothetical protein n=1 Tax=Candidatus Phytoplasma pyri TaxID=47566 RepID=UPI00398335F6